jgi:Flp pilus assembly protein TadG
MIVGSTFHAGKAQMQTRPGGRLGVAAVEAAITLPMLILLVFGSIEVANGIFLNQALSLAAHEGAREAGRPGGTSAMAQARVADVLTSRGIQQYSITIVPPVTETTPRGILIMTTVSAPMNSFAIHSMGILGNRTSTQSVCMVKH